MRLISSQPLYTTCHIYSLLLVRAESLDQQWMRVCGESQLKMEHQGQLCHYDLDKYVTVPVRKGSLVLIDAMVGVNRLSDASTL